MNITIGDFRIVRADPLNFAIEQRKVVGKARNPYGRKGRAGGVKKVVEASVKKERWVHLGWYSYLESALQGVFKLLVERNLPDHATELQTILDAVESAKDEIKEVVQTQLVDAYV